MQVSDLHLIRKARAGDKAAFHELVDRHAGRLYRIAYSMVGNSADAEDIVQETFMAAYRHIHVFREEASVKTWLTRILARQAAKCHRSRKRHRTFPIESAGVIEKNANARDEKHGDAMEMLESLSPMFREVLVLREIEGYSYDEIAEILGVPRGTVESRLFRARQALREKFGEKESG